MGFDISQIMSLIPHRYPFLLIDKVIDIVPGISAFAIKNVTINEPFFVGHFPGNPIMPGVLIVEAMAQSAAVFVSAESGSGMGQKVAYFMSIENAKFRKPVVPGDVLCIYVTKIQSRLNVWKMRGEVLVSEQKVAEAMFSAMILDRPK